MKQEDREQFVNKKNKIRPLEKQRFYPRKNHDVSGDTIVVACSGPSLNKVKLFNKNGTKKFPIVAVSTSIRKIPNPDVWCTAQKISKVLKRKTQYGTEGKKAFNNKNILKAVTKIENSSSPVPASLRPVQQITPLLSQNGNIL